MRTSYSVSPKVIILTEAGKGIGFGHYTRCTALSQALKENGCNVDTIVFFKELDFENPDLIRANWLQDEAIFFPRADNDIVIVDSYLANEELYTRLKNVFDKVIVFDDYNRISYAADILINPNVFFEEIDYSNQTAKCIGGKDFVILRKEFRIQSKTTTRENIQEILVTIGGSDFRNILPLVAKACLETDIAKITIIAPEGIESAIKNNRLNILGLQDEKSMCDVMQNADIVISGCGQTLHELAALGKSTIGICLDVDQIPNQKYYLQKEFLGFEIKWDDADLKDKIKMAIALYEPSKKRKQLAQSSLALINRNGIMNIVSAVKNLV